MASKKKFSIKEIAIMETALKIMFAKDFDAVSISEVSAKAKIRLDVIQSLYTTDDELRMEAVEYAGVRWVEDIRIQLNKEKNTLDKLKLLIKLYVSGSQTHPESLSIYVDLWKKLRDNIGGENTYIKSSLESIYRYYVQIFKEVFTEIALEQGGHCTLNQNQVEHLAWIMVVLSDGLHIQSLIQSKPLDFEGIRAVLYPMVEGLLISAKEEL